MEYPVLTKFSKGQLLIEILVALGLCTLLIPVVYAALVTGREGRVQEETRLEASVYLRECQEALKSVRENSWNNLPAVGTYHPLLSGSTFTFPVGTETIASRFTRSIVIDSVQRNSGGTIVSSGGTLDPSTLKATCTVSWLSPVTSSVSSVTYLTRYLSNTSWEITTKSQFDAGTYSSTVSQNSIDGEVILASSASGSWTSPSLVSNYNDSGTVDALHVVSDGTYAYLAKAGNPSVVIVNVSTPASPTLTGSVIVTGNVADLALSGNYIYASTTNNSRELAIVDITNKAAPVNVGNGNLAGNSDGISVYYSSNYAYIGRTGAAGGDKEFGIVDVTNVASPSVSSSLEISFNVNSLVVSGNYAFLGTNNGSNEIYVVDVTNKASPTIVANVNLPGTAQVNSLAISGNSLYVGTNNNTSGVEFYVLNISNPLAISTSDSYEIGSTVFDITYSSPYAYLVRNSTTNTFMVLNVATPSSISLVGTTNLTGTATGVSVSGSYAYVSNRDDNTELQIILGGSGSGGSYQTSGTYESSTFDAGSSAAFNYLTFNTNKPSGTNVELQVAINDLGTGWTYVGPDGTSGTFYSSDGPISLLNTKGRYFRTKAFLTGNGSATPQLQSFRINYSP